MKSVCVVGLLSLFMNQPILAETNPADFERVLVPIFFQGERVGANSARWASQLWVRNESDQPILLLDSSQACYFGPCLTPLPPPIPPQQTVRVIPNVFSDELANPSLLLYARKDQAASLRFSDRFADLSRSSVDAGATIPVVRESQMGSQQLTFFDVALPSDARALLRLYDVAFEEGHAAYVDIFDFENDQLLAEIRTVFSFSSPALGGPFSAAPGYAEVVLGSDNRTPRVRVVVRVDPNGRGRSGSTVTKLWGAVSSTRNADNRVTVMIPQ